MKTLLPASAVTQDINAIDKDGKTQLYNAVYSGNYAQAKKLLAKKADVNKKDNNGFTPLMVASLNGKTNMVKLLLKYNADTGTEDEFGWTASSYAMHEDYDTIVTLIFEHACKFRKNALYPLLDYMLRGTR